MNSEIEKNFANIKGDISRLNSKIDGHIGDYSPKAHPNSLYGMPGFMSGKQAQGYVSERVFVQNNKDGSKQNIELLENGFYFSNCNYLTGLPKELEGTETLILLDVYNYGGSRKQIKLIEGWNNRIWVKNFHSSSGNEPNMSVGWILQSGSVLLWSGAQSYGTLLLQGNRKYYQYLEILYRNESNNRYSTKILRDTTSFSLTTENIPGDSNLNISVAETALSITDTSIAFGESKAILVSASSAKEITGSESQITITTVLGVNG